MARYDHSRSSTLVSMCDFILMANGHIPSFQRYYDKNVRNRRFRPLGIPFKPLRTAISHMKWVSKFDCLWNKGENENGTILHFQLPRECRNQAPTRDRRTGCIAIRANSIAVASNKDMGRRKLKPVHFTENDGTSCLLTLAPILYTL